MSNPICYVGKCQHEALWRIENSENGKIYLMCEVHKNGFNRKPLTVLRRI